MENWNGTILGPPHVSVLAFPCEDVRLTVHQSAHENRIYSLKIRCGPDYPDVAPDVQFISKVVLPCVDPRDGKVDLRKIPTLATWKRDTTMETCLVEIRR